MNTLADWIAPARAALLIIDTQVDFAAPDGALARAGADLSKVPAVLQAVEALASAARAAQALVVFVGLSTQAATDSPVWAERARRLGMADAPLCRLGSPGAAFHGPQPAAGDLVIGKARYSAFYGTDLDARLRRQGIDTLVLCGLTTECCVTATAFDAWQRDYHIILPTDAVAAYDDALHRGALQILALNCAVLAAAAQVVAAWRG